MNRLWPQPGGKRPGGDEFFLLAEQQPTELPLVVVAQFQAAVEQCAKVRVPDRRFFGFPDP